jgi:hypothetical protein
MEPLLKSFSLGFLLRSVFGGVFFVIAYHVASQEPSVSKVFDFKGLFPVGLLVALFAGVTVYGLHRSLIYPFIELVINSSDAKNLRQRFPLISETTVTLLIQQWDRAGGTDKRDNERARHVTVWADYAQLQYSAALCICAGGFAGFITEKGPYQPHWPLVILALMLFVAGVISDWRLHVVQERLQVEPA